MNKSMSFKYLITLTTATLVACGGSDGKDGAAGTAGADAVTQLVALSVEGRSAPQGTFQTSAAEIVAFEKTTGRIFTVNAASGKVDVYDASSAAKIAALSAPERSIDLPQLLVSNGKTTGTSLVGAANSVATSGNLVAIAVEANPKTDNGWVVFLNASTLAYVNAVQVGALPDMITFSPDGTKLLVANEGEPNVGYTIDPEGTVSVIKVSDFSVATIDFKDFNVGGTRNSELPATKMILGGVGASVAQDLEPEYIAVRPDSLEAYVSLQEASAIAVLDLSTNKVKKIIGMGFKDYSIPGNELDVSRNDGVNLKTWPVFGMYQPDSIAAYTVNDRTYVVTANEGDSREDWLAGVNQTNCEAAGYYYNTACRDELTLRDVATNTPSLVLSTELSNYAASTDTTLGRMTFSFQATKKMNGSTITRLYGYGGRSFSIWDVQTGERVFDSGGDFERITANRYGSLFNQDHNGNLTGDRRSNSKGPEPEALTLGVINGRTYSFIGLERMGGVMVYDISNPNAPSFVQYLNNRDVNVAPNAAAALAGSDLGPEGFSFVSAANSSDGIPRLIVGNEVSGTTTVYRINVTPLR